MSGGGRCARAGHRIIGSLAVVAVVAAVGCSHEAADPDWVVARLGESTGRKLVAKESREILARQRTLDVDAKLEAGCLLDLVHASLADEGVRTFRVTAIASDGSEHPLVEEVVRGQAPWQESRHSVPIGGIASLRFELDGDLSGSLWGRPIAHCPVAAGEREPTNVILVSLDTLRADRLGAYGNAAGLTPNLDRIAQQGSLFQSAYAPYPNTLSSHATLFTGLHPSQHGVIAGRLRHIPDHAKTLARAFAEAGHYAVGFTENGYVSSNFGFANGFDRYHNGADLVRRGQFPGNAKDTFDRAFSWLDKRTDVPFFMFLHTYEVHIPYDPDLDLITRLRRTRNIRTKGRFESRFGSLFALSVNRGQLDLSPSEWKMVETLYDAEVIGLDAQVGRLEEKLEALGLVDRTLLVLVSDHGDEFDEHGFIGHGETIHRQVLHVPMIFRQPGNVPAGRRLEAPVGLLDVGPTIAAFAGIAAPFPDAPAQSLEPQIRGTAPGAPRPVFSELESSLGACKMREAGQFRPCPFGGVAVREGTYAFIHRAGQRGGQLYDYTSDPEEQSNIADAEPERAARFKALVNEYRTQVSQTRQDGAAKTAVDPDVAEKLKALGYVE
ncbi:MAG: sulfatase [bacterium]|nr:sulfatase [bacterium]